MTHQSTITSQPRSENMQWHKLHPTKFNPVRMLIQEHFFQKYVEKFGFDGWEQELEAMSEEEKMSCIHKCTWQILNGVPLPTKENVTSTILEIKVRRPRFRNKVRVERLRFELDKGLAWYGILRTREDNASINNIAQQLDQLKEKLNNAVDTEVRDWFTQLREQVRFNTKNIRSNTKNVRSNTKRVKALELLKEEAMKFILGKPRSRASYPPRTSTS